MDTAMERRLYIQLNSMKVCVAYAYGATVLSFSGVSGQ